jgi:hypothetical protein
MIDFGDSLCGFHEYEFVAPGVPDGAGQRELQGLCYAPMVTASALDLDFARAS